LLLGIRTNLFQKTLAALTCWYIWLERNNVIFDEKSPSVSVVVYKTLGSLNRLPQSHNSASLRACSIIHKEGFTIACFDGAAISGGKLCGVGGVIKSPESTVYRWYINCGEGTNTKVELMGVWATLTLVQSLVYSKFTDTGGLKGSY
jgi:hypothetical protein